jgi:hypothetical protein
MPDGEALVAVRAQQRDEVTGGVEFGARLAARRPMRHAKRVTGGTASMSDHAAAGRSPSVDPPTDLPRQPGYRRHGQHD